CSDHKDCLPADPANAFFGTSCKDGKMEGIGHLRQALLRELEQMEQVWTFIPPELMAAKSELEKRRKQDEETLSFDDWEELCSQANVPEADRDGALQLLRDLGTVVSFPEDNRLVDLGVLNPSWVTGAIYPLLTSMELAAAGGLLQRNELGK